LERKLLLLIDDWRPYEAAQASGIEVVNSLAYLVGLYEQKRITLEPGVKCLGQNNAPRNDATRMDPICNEGRGGDPAERGKPMKNEKHGKTTVT
jgi:hypothetical protein